MLVFAHNPDYYNTATIGYYWEYVAGYGSPGGTPGVRADGYLGRNALTSTGGHSQAIHIPRYPPIAENNGRREWRLGCRYRFEDAFPADFPPLLTAHDANGDAQCQLVINPDGTLSIYRGDLTEEIAGPSTTALALDTTYRLGFRGYADRSAGYADAWIGGTRILRANGNTGRDGDRVEWSMCGYGLVEGCAVNHVYAIDSWGYLNNLMPSLLVKVVYPDANGSLTDWEANTGTVPTAIDDAVPDLDTTRIGVYADQDAYTVAMEALEETAGIIAVQQTALVKNIITDVPAFRFLVEQDGASHEGNDWEWSNAGVHDWYVSTASYFVKRRIDHGMPKNGNQWSGADVDAARFGGRLIL